MVRIWLAAVLLLVAGSAVAWDRMYRGRPADAPVMPRADRLAVFEHRPSSRAAPARTATTSSPPPRVHRPPPRLPSAQSADPSPRIWTVRRGDSLYGIAEEAYGDPMRWRDIARLNGLREPFLIRAGQSLRLP